MSFAVLQPNKGHLSDLMFLKTHYCVIDYTIDYLLMSLSFTTMKNIYSRGQSLRPRFFQQLYLE